MSSNVLYKILIFLACLSTIASALSTNYTLNFNKCNPGKPMSHKNLAGRVKILVCAGEKNGVPQWQYTDAVTSIPLRDCPTIKPLRQREQFRAYYSLKGSSTLGEIFNPARDCPDIVDHLPEAEDGFYWISWDNKTKHKIWCDVHTDDGGFMLVGMKDSPVSWTVPSNSTPVDPRGPAHWSSNLGDLEILDFGIQFSSDNTFEETKAHWFYRLKQKRQLGNLFTNDVSSGCTKDDPGIGDVAYVKDVRTETVSTTNFKCSIFGPHTHPSLGWARMNHCLRNDCKNGYGVIPGPFPFPYAQYGSYSYSTVSASSGTERNSTAFVGCDGGKCCACFGPKGGRKDYCGPKCTTINGGTLMKKVFVWFWVRTRMPERLWKKCMEFTMRNSVGRLEKYFIDPRTGSVHKGSCSEQFKKFLNEGTLTVADKENFEKIPDVPGLLSYRKDNKKLYVNEGTKWEALGKDQEVQQLQQKVETQEKTIQVQEKMIKEMEKKQQELKSSIKQLDAPSTCTELRQRNHTLPSGIYNINPKRRPFAWVAVYCNMTLKYGTGVTVIGHDSESSTEVNGYEAHGSYSRKIKYDISMEQIIGIIKRSQKCEQFIKYKCYNAGFWFDAPASWWVSRDGAQMKYWGGAQSGSMKCKCGMTNSCIVSNTRCNCDQNNNIWTEDSGYLTDKITLPVTELRFGDTSTFDNHEEIGYHTLGKLRCWG